MSSYPALLESGELERRADLLWSMLGECRLCPRECGANRLKGETGFCRVGRRAVLSSYGPHFGEERPISGRKGSGTVFFGGCNLGCVFCQNHEISHGLAGYEAEPEMLAFAFLSLQHDGCHNINLVTPSHVVPQVVKAVLLAAREGLTIPIVYNCGGYEKVETLRLLEGIVDIYMPDFKFWDQKRAVALAQAPAYREAATAALQEMHRQVGDLKIEGGLAVRGLLVRHLLLPGAVGDAASIARWLASTLSKETYLNLMDQYRPCNRAREFPDLARRITDAEFQAAAKAAIEAGLKRLDHLIQV